MRSLYDFIIEPIGDRYANSKKVGKKDLILNTKVESWKFVNRLAKVIETPIAFSTPIKKGDIIARMTADVQEIEISFLTFYTIVHLHSYALYFLFITLTFFL